MKSFEEILFAIAGKIMRETERKPDVARNDSDLKKEKIRNLIRLGAKHITNNLYDEAIMCFSEAVEIDRESIGANLSMIKGLRAKGADLEALKWGGFTLALTSDPQHRKLVHMLLGGVALDVYRLSHHLPHAEQCLSFYLMALDDDPIDIRPLWNTIEVHAEVVKNSEGTIREQAMIGVRNKIKAITGQQLNDQNTHHFREMLNDRRPMLSNLRAASVPDVDLRVLDDFLDNASEELRLMDQKSEMKEETETVTSDSRKKQKSIVLAYVLALAIGIGGLLLTGNSEAAELSPDYLDFHLLEERGSFDEYAATSVITSFDNGDTYNYKATLDGGQGVFFLTEVSPSFAEFEEISVIEPNWSEIIRQ